MKMLIIFLGMGAVMVVPVGYAAPKMLGNFSFATYEDWDGKENCIDYAVLKDQRSDAAPVSHKLCGAGGYPRFVSHGNDVAAFIDIEGGSGAGWGLYRYSQKRNQIDRYDFNARAVTVKGHDDKGVWLDVAYAVPNLRDGGYKSDRVERWYWAFDNEVPVRQ